MGPWGGGRPGGALDPGVEAHVANQHLQREQDMRPLSTNLEAGKQLRWVKSRMVVKTCFETKKSTKFSETQNVAMVEKS